MRIDDETLAAFADGELPSKRAAEIAAAIALDPGLTIRLQRIQAVRTMMSSLKDEAPEPPAGLMEKARQAVARQASASPVRAWAPAMAAGVAGLMLGLGVSMVAGRTDTLALGPRMTATGLLAQALDRTPSGQATERGGTGVAPLYTVVAADGRACRAFRVVEAAGAYEGAACREGNDWRVMALAPTQKPEGGFIQASGDEPAAITAAIDALDPGDPLAAAAERAEMAAGWKPLKE